MEVGWIGVWSVRVDARGSARSVTDELLAAGTLRGRAHVVCGFGRDFPLARDVRWGRGAVRLVVGGIFVGKVADLDDAEALAVLVVDVEQDGDLAVDVAGGRVKGRDLGGDGILKVWRVVSFELLPVGVAPLGSKHYGEEDVGLGGEVVGGADGDEELRSMRGFGG